MPRDLYDCTAAELATHSVEHLQHDTPPRTAAEWLAENGYDAAPVYKENSVSAPTHWWSGVEARRNSQKTTRHSRL
jgi:hypothetical protein